MPICALHETNNLTEKLLAFQIDRVNKIKQILGIYSIGYTVTLDNLPMVNHKTKYALGNTCFEKIIQMNQIYVQLFFATGSCYV